MSLLLAAVLAHALLPGSGIGLWWPTSAVLLVYLWEGELRRRAPVAVAVHAAVTLAWAADVPTELTDAFARAAALVAAHAAAITVQRRTATRHEDPHRGRILLLLACGAAAGVVSTALALLGGSWTTAAIGVALTTVVGHTAALLALVPLWWAWRDGTMLLADRGIRARVTATAAVAATLGVVVGAAPAGRMALFAVAALPVLRASLQWGAGPSAITSAAYGVSTAVGLAVFDTPTDVAVRAQLGVIATLIVAHLITRALAPTDIGASAEPNTVLPELRPVIARRMRDARMLAAIGLTSIAITGAIGRPDISLRAALEIVSIAALALLLNAVSGHWDRAGDHTYGRVAAESVLDAALVVGAATSTLPTSGAAVGDPVVLLFCALLAVRLGRRHAIAVAAATAFTVALTRVPAVAGMETGESAADLVVSTILLVAAGGGLAAGVAWLVDQVATLRAAAAQATSNARAADSRDRMSRAELAESIEQLERTNEELRQTRSQLEQFAAVVSHDLRSPIATARTFAVAAHDDRLPLEARGQFHERIVPNLDRAARLIERLYGYATTSTTQLRHAPADLNRVLRGVTDDYSAALERFGVTVRQPHLLPRIECDEALVGQMLANLLGNAIRYAPGERGHATVEITASWQDDGLVLTIGDDGPGIPDGIARNLFQAGTRGHEHGRGMGLGLATARTVAERHGGRIWAHRSHLGGAAFSILLPAPLPRRMRVLVVEDDPEQRLAYRRTITAGSPETQVVEAPDLASARAALEDGTPFDLAIVDVQLPDGSGVDLLPALAQLATPMHLVVGMPTEEVQAQASAHGAQVRRKDEVLADARVGTLLGATLGV